MLKWLNNKMIVLAVMLAFSMWLPAGIASAGGYYYGHHGYGHHYGYGYGHYYGGHEHGHHGGYGHHYAYYGLGAYALYGLFGHYGHDYGDHYYGSHYYTPYYEPYYGHYSYPYSYGYSSYSHESHVYNQHQEGDRITHSSDGWKLLRDNHPNDALNAFAIEARNHPAKGMPKVGYALASAETGQLDRGVWAMRRALRFDPESLHYMTVDQTMRIRIRALIHRYDYDSSSAKATDAAFMRASLHYLLRESAEARHAMDQAMQANDDTVSSRNLNKLLHEKL